MPEELRRDLTRPVGRVAAARLIERGIELLVIETASLAGAKRLDVGDVRLFWPWRCNIARRLMAWRRRQRGLRLRKPERAALGYGEPPWLVQPARWRLPP